MAQQAMNQKIPQKSVQPVMPQNPQAAQPAGMDLAGLIGRNVIGSEAYTPFFNSLGFDGASWMDYGGGGNDENGNPLATSQSPGTQTFDKANGYTFDWQDTGYGNTGTLTAFDPTGAQYGQYKQTDTPLSQSILEAGALAAAGFGGAGLLGLGPLAGMFGGAAGAGAAAQGGGTAGGLIGAGEGAAQLAAYTAANPLTAAGVTAATLPAAGLPGLGAAAAGAAGATAGGLIGAGEGAAQLAAYTAANPLTAAGVTASTLPAAGLPGLGTAGAALGSTGLNAMRAGEIAGYSTNGALPGSAAVATGNGGLMSQLPGFVGNAATWMKENPLLGRLATGGATALLAGSGGSSGGSGGSAGAPSGPPVQWNSPIQKGLLSPVQQYSPPPVQQQNPAGLLAQGQANDGAWRWMKG